MSDQQLSFAVIGSGRVATHLAQAFLVNGFDCLGVWSRNSEHARTLAQRLHCPLLPSLSTALGCSATFVLIAISDDALQSLSSQLQSETSLLIHTSGSTPIDVLSNTAHYGVLYPLQTFSLNRTIGVDDIPFFIEGNDTTSTLLLQKIATRLSHQAPIICSSAQRKQLHLAAVFACNFVNQMYSTAVELLEKAELPISVLYPLMRETLNKAIAHDPRSVQTGPAVRGDLTTIQRHLEILKDSPQEADLYRMISDYIHAKAKKK